MNRHHPRPRELHLSRRSRDKYQFEDTLFALHGDVVFADFHAVRRFVQRMNEKRNVIDFPERAIRAGDINGMGLIHEILHYMIALFEEQRNNRLFYDLLDYLEDRFEPSDLQKLLTAFTDEFPPVAVYRRDTGVEDYLDAESDGEPHTHIMLEELLLLWLSNTNPAFTGYLELFDDTRLEKNTKYVQVVEAAENFFKTQPPFGPSRQSLFEMLQAPAKASPHSITGQLEWIREHWGSLLGEYFYRLLRSLDFIKEETKLRGLGAGPARAYDFTGEAEHERFSPDKDWMPNTILIAKNIYVWLDQLSRQYERSIERLDQIPGEELDTLARWGFTGLWLIGLWERSRASRRIKQMMGNPEAVASAYSLEDYNIADDLGGNEAYRVLREKAWQRGIRLAGDMVPNHMGIDSHWVIQHPDWFVSLPHSPFPSYSFNGQDISDDDRVQIYLEDHYYERSDASVVFKRVDGHTGDTQFIYHGNDGTSMPWNDTAQLNFLNQEVREAVIRTILHVARNFDIIRFDAAMTLAKKHYQRLWFPEPGTGGDIPSRAEYGMTREEFDKAFPKEFWREVVDRVAEEEPDTLLLAEAFWLMEGYFVRTLGMHRVYNSAFMNMLKTEDNAKYRQTIKNVLEFNPEILKRFVNFMNNPDEETAVAQFGKDDKYFGVCVLLVTMPGLPMFGHGQVEGFTEKYGMEFKRSYWDETPDPYLVERHEREIFPLMRKRYIFSESKNFLLYDLYTPEGYVNENVFAYSNRAGDERGLVIYNNKFDQAKGTLHTSAAYMEKSGNTDDGHLAQQSLGEGLHLRSDDDYFTIFRDVITGLEYIRNNRHLHEHGLYVELGAFKYQAFVDFREVEDVDGMYSELAEYLNGRGVPSIEEALQETLLQPVHNATRPVLNTENFRRWYSGVGTDTPDELIEELFGTPGENGIEHFLGEIKAFTGATGDEQEVAAEMRNTLGKLLQLPGVEDELPSRLQETVPLPGSEQTAGTAEDRLSWAVLFSWALVRNTGQLRSETDVAERSRSWIDDLLLSKIIRDFIRELGFTETEAAESETLVKILTTRQQWFDLLDDEPNAPYRVMENLLQSGLVREYLRINRHQETLWFNQEAFQRLCRWLGILAACDYLNREDGRDALAQHLDLLEQFDRAKEESGFQVAQLLDALKSEEASLAEK